MCSSQIGLALGAIASYAVSKDVPFVRIIFCDAEATDAGYMAPEDIAGRVEITGRGGTALQSGVDALERATLYRFHIILNHKSNKSYLNILQGIGGC